MNASAIKRVLNPERNVGGGDLVVRLFAIGAVAILVGVVLPQLAVPWPLLKISLLICAEVGLVFLLLGMFLQSKTYFAGFQLFLASLLMLLLASRGLAYVAVAVGLAFIAIGVNEVVSRRSRLNGLLGVSSYVEDAGATLLEQALAPEAADPRPVAAPALDPKPTQATR